MEGKIEYLRVFLSAPGPLSRLDDKAYEGFCKSGLAQRDVFAVNNKFHAVQPLHIYITAPADFVAL